jgi:hypothetical protein
MLDSRAVLLLRIWMLLKEPLDFVQDLFTMPLNWKIRGNHYPGYSATGYPFDEQYLLDTF